MGASIIKIGFWGPLYYKYKGPPPPQKKIVLIIIKASILGPAGCFKTRNFLAD